MFSYSKFEHSNTESAFKIKEPISNDFKVYVNGEEIPVYTCRISKYPFNRPWPGFQRPVNQTMPASFVNIVSDEDVNIEVEVNAEYENIFIKPYSKKITYTEKNGRICFTIPKEQNVVLNADDFSHCLYIFNSKPITCENPDEVTYYFGPGIHLPGKITLHDNKSIYVDKDALVYGCIFAENAKNIKIFGNGMFDDSAEERFFIHCYEEYTNGNIKFYDCENVTVEGVLFKNSAIWCVNIFHCSAVVLDDIKVFGQWRYNTDGVDIVNSHDVAVKNSFIHSFDDTISIKGIDRYATSDNKNIHIDNCMLCCDWGRCCEIGFETECREYEDISFTNCDIFHLQGGGVALDIQNGDCAEVHDVLFENINVEYNAFSLPEIIQENDDDVYTGKAGAIPTLIGVTNNRFRKDYSNDVWCVPFEDADIDLTGIKQACSHDIIFRNINVFYDERLPLADGKYDIRVNIKSFLPDVEYYNITIENITVNGEKFDL